MEWYDKIEKSPLTPPKYVFKYVWPILYLLMFISFSIIAKDEKCYQFCDPLKYFMVQFILNITWTTLFFKYKMTKTALLSIVIMIIFTLITILQFYQISKVAAYLLIPYVLWLFFAAYLTAYINSKLV